MLQSVVSQRLRPKEKKEPKLEELPVDTEAAPKPVKAKAKIKETSIPMQ